MPDYRLFPANGAWGGVLPKGDFRVDFFVESQLTPSKVISEVAPEGKSLKEIQRVLPIAVPENRTLVRRQFVCGILISVETARSIANFIDERLEHAEETSGESE